ncbi:hypothetical protein D6764_05285 [Candidatus Woesearchaeota archaeon]|nr:MAG: hypothetical protein D6764_05285 [Candidatus Woesearchaeota archaeon]
MIGASELERMIHGKAMELIAGKPYLTGEELNKVLAGEPVEDYAGNGFYQLVDKKPRTRMTKNPPVPKPLKITMSSEEAPYVWVPTDFQTLYKAMEKLDGLIKIRGNNPEDYYFLDPGAGDGRTGLVAETFGLKPLMWEADPDMHRVAAQNIADAESSAELYRGNGLDGVLEWMEQNSDKSAVIYSYLITEKTARLARHVTEKAPDGTYLMTFMDDVRKSLRGRGLDRTAILYGPIVGSGGIYIYRIC